MGLTVCPQPDFDTPVRALITRLVDEAGGDIATLLRMIGQDPDEWVEIEERKGRGDGSHQPSSH